MDPCDHCEEVMQPFLDRSLPVNLATIPNVRSDVYYPLGPLMGQPEGFLVAAKGVKPGTYPIGSNEKLIEYLRTNPGYKIVHHAYHHEFVNGRPEFDNPDGEDVHEKKAAAQEALACEWF